MTIKEALKKYSLIEIDFLLSHVLGKSKEFLYMNPEYRMSENQKIRLKKFIKRREKGEPVAYILGYKDFYGLRFKVNRDVLIPRPETEELIHKVLKVCKAHKDKKALRILDLGAGSGCIAVSLAKQLQTLNIKYQITASDISKKALTVAKHNAKKHQVKIHFIHSDILENLRMNFGTIVANLPYVPKKIYDLKFKDLRFEPKQALADGTNKFEIYQKFFQQVPRQVQKGSIIYLEIDPRAKMAIANWAKKYLPGADIKFYRDLNNFWRYAEIKN